MDKPDFVKSPADIDKLPLPESMKARLREAWFPPERATPEATAAAAKNLPVPVPQAEPNTNWTNPALSAASSPAGMAAIGAAVAPVVPPLGLAYLGAAGGSAARQSLATSPMTAEAAAMAAKNAGKAAGAEAAAPEPAVEGWNTRDAEMTPDLKAYLNSKGPLGAGPRASMATPPKTKTDVNTMLAKGQITSDQAKALVKTVPHASAKAVEDPLADWNAEMEQTYAGSRGLRKVGESLEDQSKGYPGAAPTGALGKMPAFIQSGLGTTFQKYADKKWGDMSKHAPQEIEARNNFYETVDPSFYRPMPPGFGSKGQSAVDWGSWGVGHPAYEEPEIAPVTIGPDDNDVVTAPAPKKKKTAP